MIGYELNKQLNGNGYMTEAIRLVVEFAFNELLLHRIEAGEMPHNIGSIYSTDESVTIVCTSDCKNIIFNVKAGDYKYASKVSSNSLSKSTQN